MRIHKSWNTDPKKGSVGCIILPQDKVDELAGLVKDHGGARLFVYGAGIQITATRLRP
jgi:hypothetical protein